MAPESFCSESSIGKMQKRTIQVQNITTHLIEAGPVDAPPLLYLHGAFMGNLWLDFHQSLAQHFHLFAPDIPGFGLTKRPDWMRDMSDYTLFLRDLLNALKLEQTNVVGYSLGGWLAAELAVWYPERIQKLVLSNAAGLRIKGLPIRDIFAMSAKQWAEATFEEISLAMPYLPESFEDIDYLATNYRERTTLAALAWNPSYDPKLERRLKAVSCPTLIVWGESDRIIPPDYADAYQRSLPHSLTVKIPGTGHVPLIEQEQTWSRVISDFLMQDALAISVATGNAV